MHGAPVVFLLYQKGAVDWLARTMDRLYTVKEAAEFLRCSARTVRRIIATGELPAVPLRVGAGVRRQPVSWRIRESAIERFLRARERVPLDTRASISGQKITIGSEGHGDRSKL